MTTDVQDIQGFNPTLIRDLPVPDAARGPRPTRVAPPPAVSDLLGLVLDSTRAQDAPPLESFLEEPSPAKAIAAWLARTLPGWSPTSSDVLARLFARHIAALDRAINEQLNEILHHERFQKLEASWRGLSYLVDQTESDENVKIRMLNCAWPELVRDAERATEFDQSQLFTKVYTEGFDQAGAEPFSVLIGDYYVQHNLTDDHPTDDVSALRSISQVSAAAFAPFIAGAHPQLLGLPDYSHLDRPRDFNETFRTDDYLKWRQFRDTEDSRFIGLTLPRVLMRLPYADDGSRADGFRFREDVEGPDSSKYLWGNASFAFAAVLVREFRASGWLAEIRGFQRDNLSGGIVSGLPVHSFGTDSRGVAMKCSTETLVGDLREKELGDAGFIPLSHCKDTGLSVFYGNQSVQKPKVYDKAIANTNARISSMLQYILCASRFAHYLKVKARNKIGAFTEEYELEDYLRNWVTEYVANDENASPSTRAKYPLREAEVKVRATPGSPGSYQCVMHLLPHAQLDSLSVAIKLTTELRKARA